MEKIRENLLPQITTKQLNNLKSRLKEKKHGKSSTNLNEIIEWCNNKLEIPTDLDEPFCGGIDYDLDHKEQLKYLRIFITTSRLIQQLKYNCKYFIFIMSIFFLCYLTYSYSNIAKLIATDGTYKLNFQGFPVLMVGTVDHERQYHPYGILITKTVNAEDYKYMFQTLKNLSINYKYEFNPTILLADTAAEITNGFKEVFNQGNLFITFFYQQPIKKFDTFFFFL